MCAWLSDDLVTQQRFRFGKTNKRALKARRLSCRIGRLLTNENDETMMTIIIIIVVVESVSGKSSLQFDCFMNEGDE